MRSRLRLKRQFSLDPKSYFKNQPVPPRSEIVVREDNPGPYSRILGQRLRVGYYSKQDGLNVIWIVYPNAEYAETTNHMHLRRHFRVVVDSGESDYFGEHRPVLEPLQE